MHGKRFLLYILVAFFFSLFVFALWHAAIVPGAGWSRGKNGILVSYSYFEKDSIQVRQVGRLMSSNACILGQTKAVFTVCSRDLLLLDVLLCKSLQGPKAIAPALDSCTAVQLCCRKPWVRGRSYGKFLHCWSCECRLVRQYATSATNDKHATRTFRPSHPALV